MLVGNPFGLITGNANYLLILKFMKFKLLKTYKN